MLSILSSILPLSNPHWLIMQRVPRMGVSILHCYQHSVSALIPEHAPFAGEWWKLRIVSTGAWASTSLHVTCQSEHPCWDLPVIGPLFINLCKLQLAHGSSWIYVQPCCLGQKSTWFGNIAVPNSSTLAWQVPWTEEPGGLQSMGSPRVGHNWATSLSLFTFMHWRRKWQPTSVFLPGESQGEGSLVGCRLWGRTELDMTEAT